MIEKLILTLTEHAAWGPILQPVLVSEELSGALTILETVSCKSTFFSNLSPEEKELVVHAEKVSDKTLMKNYSKEKSIQEFHKKVTTETRERYIRPIIEGFHRKAILFLKTAQIELYFRNAIKTRVLYDIDRIVVSKNNSAVIFNFEKNTENGLRYFINLKLDDAVFDLYSKSHFGLCTEPASLVINHKLHTFNDIDIKKLLPFFSKKNIQVPLSAEKSYIQKFVKNCVEKYEVIAIGIKIEKLEPEKKAILSLEGDWSNRPVLYLKFKYNDKIFSIDSPNKKNVFVEESNGETFLSWFYPDKTWESELISKLQSAGLEKIGLNHFALPIKTEEEEKTENSVDTTSIVEWLSCNHTILMDFEFQQSIPEKNYYIGEISIDSDIETKQDWFDIHVMAVFGDFKIPFSRFKNHILNNIREYILPDDTIAILPLEWFTNYYELMLFSKMTDEKMRLKKHHLGLVNLLQGKKKTEIVNFDYKKDYPLVPTGINAELRNYQHKGFAWLVHLFENNFGGCLADDMGLGKTLQTITLLQHVSNLHKKKAEGIEASQTTTKKENKQLSIFDSVEVMENPSFPSMIVMPTSLIHNWQNEFKKFAPTLKVYIYLGVKRLKTNDIYKVFDHYDVVLTTYGTLRNDIDILQHCQFHHLILDESQYVKNPDSMAYKSVKHINALHKIALTGTPVENSLTDLWAQLNIVNEGLLGSQNSFRNAYIHPILKNNKAKEESLLRIIEPFILRRTKDEVAPELPPLSQETVYCDMSDDQQAAYNEEKNKLRSSLLMNDSTLDHQKLAFLTLQGLSRLRTLANHPVLMDEEYRGDSGKFEQIIMRFETLKSENHKVLIFSSYVKHLRLLADYFDKEEWNYAWLSGSTPASSRQIEIEKFKNDPTINCFFISLKAGGVGLNLTAADYVFIIDPWWNPASEMQALSRSHRIGQDKKVMVYRFISSDTIEEKIRNLQESKSKLAQTFITSNNPLKDLNKEEMIALVEN